MDEASISAIYYSIMINVLSRLGHSGLFDAAFYLARNPDLRDLGSRVLAHYHQHGWREGRKPNAHFDPRWYLSQNPDVLGDPLLHYIAHGEKQGRRPIAWFDPVWYAKNHDVPDGVLALAHYLANRHKPDVKPIAAFDPAFYLRTYPDVAMSGLDPLEHYMIQGFREVRRPFETFDPAFYRSRYMRHRPDDNPLLHFIQHREQPGVFPSLPDQEATIPREIRRRTQAGPFFEEYRPLPDCAIRRALVLAYYLPQFHSNPANDGWWGKGFTEWTNVARGIPRFADHYQPRVPRDLGHYVLDDPAVLRRQVAMARRSGIDGFVFYFYWFNGQRLLDGPLEMLLQHTDIEMPFCLMWANENWSRRWDGSDDEVLIAQDYRDADDDALIACFARHMADRRYIRIDGRPLLKIYRPGAIPDAHRRIARWRRLFRMNHEEDPIFVMAQAFGDDDPSVYGMDGAIEFPPHKIVGDCKLINDRLHILDEDFTAQVYDYVDVVNRALALPPPDFPLIRTAAPSWDNDARRQGHGLVLHGSTPPLYERWLSGLIAQAQRTPFLGQAIVCVNAWNEWAEGAHLEPDLHFGAAYLNATARANTGFEQRNQQSRVLLVGHDAFPAGAQRLLLAVGRSLRAQHGVEVMFILLDDGALLEDYRAIGAVELLKPGRPETELRLKTLRREGFATALVNSAASSPLAPDLTAAGIPFTLLQHELPSLLRQRALLTPLAKARALAREVVVPSPSLAAHGSGDMAVAIHVLPQGLYTPVEFSAISRETIRVQLGLTDADRLIVGAGYADMRKGFDLFLQLWQRFARPAQDAIRRDASNPGGAHGRVHFIWLGDVDPGLRENLAPDIAFATAAGTFHLPGQVAQVSPWLSAADAFVLTSREDPYPSVVLEALASGLPCCAFAHSGGIPELLETLLRERETDHAVVPMSDLGALARALSTCLENHARRTPALRRRIGRKLTRRFSFSEYATELFKLLHPDQPTLSVVVLSYNYARYLAARLVSIFTQRMAVLEIIVLDDASTDDSVAVASDIAKEWGRSIRIVTSTRNSGSVFAQWRRAVELAKGDWIWIAEADDLSEPDHMSRLFAGLYGNPDAVMAFCDSRAIDAAGATIMPSYKPYYAQSTDGMLERDSLHTSRNFVKECLSERNLILNVSAAVFSHRALRDAFSRCDKDLATLRVAGDWRVYVELLMSAHAQIAYIAEPLNIHRRHEASTTQILAREQHLQEIARVQDIVSRHFPDDAAIATRQSAYRHALIRQFGLGPREVRAANRETA